MSCSLPAVSGHGCPEKAARARMARKGRLRHKMDTIRTLRDSDVRNMEHESIVVPMGGNLLSVLRQVKQKTLNILNLIIIGKCNIIDHIYSRKIRDDSFPHNKSGG